MTTNKDMLTIEYLAKRFNSNFELVTHASNLAKNVIAVGRDSRVPTPIKNPAYWVLLEIAEEKDSFDDVFNRDAKMDEEMGTVTSKKDLITRVIQ